MGSAEQLQRALAEISHNTGILKGERNRLLEENAYLRKKIEERMEPDLGDTRPPKMKEEEQKASPLNDIWVDTFNDYAIGKISRQQVAVRLMDAYLEESHYADYNKACPSCTLRFICKGAPMRNTLACRGARAQVKEGRDIATIEESLL